MLRVAVCLAGQPRSYWVCYKNIRSVFERDDVCVDYHIHTWTCNEGNATPRQTLNRNDLERDLIQMYSPKYLKIEDSWKNIVYPETWTISQTLKSVVGTENSENFRYDWVFVGRLDWFRPLDNKVNYDVVCQKSQTLRELWGGYEGIDTMTCEEKTYVRQEDFSYSFNSVTARLWSNIYEDRIELTRKLQDLKSFSEKSELDSRLTGCQECFFAIEATLHNIFIHSGADILEPGMPIRTTLANYIGLNIYSRDIQQKVLSFMERYGWYYSKQDVEHYFGTKTFERKTLI